jgi:hypothetical protein
MFRHHGRISTEIQQTLWRWVVAHGQEKEYVFFCQPFDDAAYPLSIALQAFGL